MKCPYCSNDSLSLIEKIVGNTYLCGVCSKLFRYETTNDDERKGADDSRTIKDKDTRSKQFRRD